MRSPASNIDSDRGAILVIGVFTAPFLVGALHYFVGCANVVMEREGLQQAADAASFATAVVSARAMNAISAMNVLMTCIMSVIVPMRALLAAYTEVASSPCHGACACATSVDAARAASELGAKLEDAEPRARQLLQALSDAQDALARQAPGLSVRAAADSARKTSFLDGSPPQVFSSSLSPSGCRKGLPVEDDSFRAVCKRTRPYVQDIAREIAGPTTLDTIGDCRSGLEALGLAQRDLLNPEGGDVCREAAQPPCTGSGPHPKKIADGGSNGSDLMQYWVSLHGKDGDDPRSGVEVAARSSAKSSAHAADRELDIGFAEAEFFFDCKGSWSGGGCNQDEGAMWNTRWTARLRRVHKPSIGFDGDAEVKSTLASPTHWAKLRSALSGVRHDFTTGRAPTTEAAALLDDSEEGPLQ
jgi:hypothetical protein